MKITTHKLNELIRQAADEFQMPIARIVHERYEALNLGSMTNEIRYLTKEVQDFETACHSMALEEFREKKYDYFAKKKRLAEVEDEFFAILDADAEIGYELTDEQTKLLTSTGLV